MEHPNRPDSWKARFPIGAVVRIVHQPRGTNTPTAGLEGTVEKYDTFSLWGPILVKVPKSPVLFFKHTGVWCEPSMLERL